MPDKSIIKPQPISRVGQNREETLGGQDGIANGANAFLSNSFVFLTAGALLSVVPTSGVTSIGLCLDASKLTAEVNPPVAPYGDRHRPLNLKGQQFAISVSNLAGAIGQVNGAPLPTAIVLGSAYGIVRIASGVYTGYHMLAVDEVTNTLFRVVDKPLVYAGVAQDATTYNPVVIVQVIDTKIQAQ